MDLRNRERFATIVGDLSQVPSGAYKAGADKIHKLAKEDEKINSEISETMNLINQREVFRKAHANGSFHELACRIHVFHVKVLGKTCLRIDAAELPSMTNGEYHMSDFVSKIDVKLLPSGESVSWNRETASIDGVTVSRQEISKAEIFVHVDYEHALFSVPAELRGDSHKDMAFCNVTNIFKLICDYIKRNHLSSDDDPSYFTPDAVLHKMLYPNHPANHPVSFASLLDCIKTHFKRPGPFKIEYEVRDPVQEKVCEIAVQVQSKFDPTLVNLIHANERKLRESLLIVDDEIATCSADIRKVGCDAAYLDKLAANPIAHLVDVLHKPTGVVKDVESAGKVDYTNMATTSEFYKQPWAVPAAAFVVGGGKEAVVEQSKPSSRRR